MSDRTYVTLTVRSEHGEQVRKIYEGDSIGEYPQDAGFVFFAFAEVNYGELGCLDQLEALGIAYESRWSDGDSYPEGRRICRFTEQGELQIIEYNDGEEDPSIGELMQRVGSPEKLARYVREYYAKFQAIPWENQIEYGKLYRTHQLISQGVA